jgi:L-threonylcarbamoyladenylate synthase
MLVLMENPALLERYVDDVPEIAWDLVEISTTPLTVIYSNAKNLATNLIADDGSVGIRFTKETFTSQLLQRFRKPIGFNFGKHQR